MMKKNTEGTPNNIKYSIWDTRTKQHQPIVEKVASKSSERFEAKVNDHQD